MMGGWDHEPLILIGIFTHLLGVRRKSSEMKVGGSNSDMGPEFVRCTHWVHLRTKLYSTSTCTPTVRAQIVWLGESKCMYHMRTFWMGCWMGYIIILLLCPPNEHASFFIQNLTVSGRFGVR